MIVNDTRQEKDQTISGQVCLSVRVGTGIKSGFKKSGFYCGFFGFFQRKFEKIRKNGFFQILYFTLPKSPKITF